MNSQIQTLLEENPWILDHKGFSVISFGLPLNRKVEDELGLVVSVLTKEDLRSMKKLFQENFGSARRWGKYPIYFDVTRPQQLLVGVENETEK